MYQDIDAISRMADLRADLSRVYPDDFKFTVVFRKPSSSSFAFVTSREVIHERVEHSVVMPLRLRLPASHVDVP